MRKIYGIVFSLSLVAAIVNACKVISKFILEHNDRLRKDYMVNTMINKYYVGIYITYVGFIVNPNPNGALVPKRIKFVYVLMETGCRTSKQATDIMDFIKKHVSSETASDLFVVNADNFHGKTDVNGVKYQFGNMESTPTVSIQDKRVLRTLAAMLVTGRLIRDSHRGKITWKGL